MSKECPICLDVKIVNKKFKCIHEICTDCFNKQKKSKQKLRCCLCRSTKLLNKNDSSSYDIYSDDDDDSLNDYYFIVSQPFMS